MTIPETLRALSAVQAGIAAEYAEMPMKAVIHEQYQAACDAGAQAYEMVEQLAALRDTAGDHDCIGVDALIDAAIALRRSTGN